MQSSITQVWFWFVFQGDNARIPCTCWIETSIRNSFDIWNIQRTLQFAWSFHSFSFFYSSLTFSAFSFAFIAFPYNSSPFVFAFYLAISLISHFSRLFHFLIHFPFLLSHCIRLFFDSPHSMRAFYPHFLTLVLVFGVLTHALSTPNKTTSFE